MITCDKAQMFFLDILAYLSKAFGLLKVFASWILEHNEELRNLGLLVAGTIGLFMLYWRAKSQDRSSIADEKNAENATKAHLVETYARAIDQLGACSKDEIPIIQTRLGALFSLEKIASMNEEYHAPVMLIICGYALECSPIDIANGNIKATDKVEECVAGTLRPDIQACLDIIGRRKNNFDNGRGFLHLSRINLSSAVINSLNFARVNFRKSSFRYALFQNADFQAAFFHLADLTKADFVNVNFKFAKFAGANLEGATFDRCDFEGANFIMTKNLTCEQIRSSKIDRRTVLPDYMKITWNDDTYECEMIEVEEK
jgi:uncharacterized protein YjbI with pentapeptide repeats